MTPAPEKQLRHRPAYPVLYMFVLTFAATGGLIGLHRLTADRVRANRQIFFERAALTALGWTEARTMPPAMVHRTFNDHVRAPAESSAGALRLIRDNRLTAYALPFEGQGFWNAIKGVIGISPDRTTLTGIAFYEQNETPGLGAEIVRPRFTDQFRNLRLDPGTPALGLQPPGMPAADNQVDAITGATQTCTRLETMLNAAIAAWREAMDALDAAGPYPSGEYAGDAQ